MQEQEVIKSLQSDLKFNDSSINKLKIFVKSVIDVNKEHNFISKSTEGDIWHRHVLDSAQLVKFISFNQGSLADLGSGAGFPGIVLAIFNVNYDSFSGLSNEIKSKLNKVRPKTLGQAIRIDGVTPAAIIIILSHIKKMKYKFSA